MYLKLIPYLYHWRQTIGFKSYYDYQLGVRARGGKN